MLTQIVLHLLQIYFSRAFNSSKIIPTNFKGLDIQPKQIKNNATMDALLSMNDNLNHNLING